jgi:hypothetical protein
MAMETEVEVTYKSGRIATGWFTKFDVFAKGSKIYKIEWDCENKCGPIHLGVDNIESVWQTGRVRETQ